MERVRPDTVELLAARSRRPHGEFAGSSRGLQQDGHYLRVVGSDTASLRFESRAPTRRALSAAKHYECVILTRQRRIDDR